MVRAMGNLWKPPVIVVLLFVAYLAAAALSRLSHAASPKGGGTESTSPPSTPHTPSTYDPIRADAMNVSAVHQGYLSGKKWLLLEAGLLLACKNCDQVLANYQAGTNATVIIHNVASKSDASRLGSPCVSSDTSLVLAFTGPTWVSVVARGVPGECEWRAEFSLRLPGRYNVQIRLLTFRGLANYTQAYGCTSSGIGLNRGFRLIGEELSTSPGNYDKCACHGWCIRTPGCVGSQYQKGTGCVIFSKITDRVAVTPSDNLLTYWHYNLTAEMRRSLPTFLGYQRNAANFPVDSAVSLVWGSQSFTAGGAASPKLPHRKQCRAMSPSHNVWESSRCDLRSFEPLAQQPVYCAGYFWKQGMGRCHLGASGKCSTRPDSAPYYGNCAHCGPYQMIYIEPDECEYVWLDPPSYHSCILDSGPNIYFVGDSMIGMLMTTMYQYILGVDSPKQPIDRVNYFNFSNSRVKFFDPRRPWTAEQEASGIYIGNSNVVHALWNGGNPPDLLAVLDKKIDALRKVKAKHKFFLLAPAISSEREPHCIFDRAVFMNEYLRGKLSPMGFHIIPFANITLPVIFDKTCNHDGLHVHPDVYRMVVTMIGNVLCKAEDYLSKTI